MSANFYPVILAGGRGTRFWPLSRKKRAKQLLALDGAQTMIQQTVGRLAPVAAAKQFWVVTNDDLRPEIVRQLGRLKKDQIIAEPVARNTAPAIGLAAFILQRANPDAIVGLFPSDHVIANPERFREVLADGIEIAGSGEHIVVLGVQPTRAETGYGYIEAGALGTGDARRPEVDERPADLPAGRRTPAPPAPEHGGRGPARARPQPPARRGHPEQAPGHHAPVSH